MIKRKTSESKSSYFSQSEDLNQSKSHPNSYYTQSDKNMRDKNRPETVGLKQSQRIKMKSRKLCEIEQATKQKENEANNKARTRGGKKPLNKQKSKDGEQIKTFLRGKKMKSENKF